MAAGNVSDQVGVWGGTEIKSTSINLQVPLGFAGKFDLLIDGSVCGELWRTLWMDCGGTSGLILTAGTNRRPQHRRKRLSISLVGSGCIGKECKQTGLD